METSQPQPDQSSDTELLKRELRQAELEDRLIPASIARLIASRWHGGQTSELYAFQSSGAMRYGIDDELVMAYAEADEPSDRLELQYLMNFIAAQETDDDGERGPVDDWHELTRWDPGEQEPLIMESGYDTEDRCVYCGAHISEPHSRDCPASDEAGDA